MGAPRAGSASDKAHCAFLLALFSSFSPPFWMSWPAPFMVLQPASGTERANAMAKNAASFFMADSFDGFMNEGEGDPSDSNGTRGVNRAVSAKTQKGCPKAAFGCAGAMRARLAGDGRSE